MRSQNLPQLMHGCFSVAAKAHFLALRMQHLEGCRWSGWLKGRDVQASGLPSQEMAAIQGDLGIEVKTAPRLD